MRVADEEADEEGEPEAQAEPAEPAESVEPVEPVEPVDPPATPSGLRRTLEWVALIAGALLVALGVRATLVQTFYIPSESMEPTLEVGDRILVNKLSYRLHDVHRGDVVVFARPPAAPHTDESVHDLIKRVIAVPGDTIESRGDGRVYLNGKVLDEPYLPAGTRTEELERRTLAEGQLYVMGDNRGRSFDSRKFGPIDEDLVVGRAFVIIFPPGDAGGL